MKVDMGSKYETKIAKYPISRDIDYDALMKFTKPKTVGGGLGGARSMAQSSSFSKSPSKSLKGSMSLKGSISLKGSMKQTPNINNIK